MIETRHPYYFDLKFFALYTSTQDITNNELHIPKNLSWITRSSNPDIKNALRESVHQNYLLAECGCIKIVRPRIGAPLKPSGDWWLELTPELIKSAYQSNRLLIWLKNTIRAFGIKRVVFSSVLEKPPSMRDLLVAAAIILDYNPQVFDEIIKTNSKRLVDEIYEIL
ncbi:MAG: hypothetical protein QW453_01975 [Thermoprotei archaeon]